MKMATFDKVDCVEIEPALILITTFDSAFFSKSGFGLMPDIIVSNC